MCLGIHVVDDTGRNAREDKSKQETERSRVNNLFVRMKARMDLHGGGIIRFCRLLHYGVFPYHGPGWIAGSDLVGLNVRLFLMSDHVAIATSTTASRIRYDPPVHHPRPPLPARTLLRRGTVLGPGTPHDQVTYARLRAQGSVRPNGFCGRRHRRKNSAHNAAEHTARQRSRRHDQTQGWYPGSGPPLCERISMRRQ